MYEILKDFGILAAVGGGIIALIVFLIKYITALARGVQALLRDRLYDKYEKYSELGYAPIHVKENFDNCYQRYHRLGKNGVMDDIHKKIMRLPTEPPKEELNEQN